MFLYRNQGDGAFAVSDFSDTLSLPDIPSGGAVWADYDNDGWRDLYVAEYGTPTGSSATSKGLALSM